MNNITLKVSGNRLEIVKDTYTTGGSVNYDGCVFNFDSTWDGFTKTAVFGFGNSDFVRAEITNNTCKIPAICIQKEGIVRIGIYGINDNDVVITTNSVAHRVDDGIEEVGDWFEEDSYFVFNALKEIEGSLEKYKDSLDERFNKLLGSVGEGSGTVTQVQSCIGEPSDWYLPTPFTDAGNFPTNSKKSEYHEYFDYLLNGLVTDFPEYVSVSEIGIDSSNTYPIYAYTFEPENYEKTVLVSSCVNGYESVTIIALSYFLDELCRNHERDRTLSYLHSKVKLVVLPAVNPYSLVQKKHLNSNNVNIGMNFPYKWQESSGNNKGSLPADQSETVAVMDFAESLSSDKLCAALDLRSVSNLYSSKMAFYPRFRRTCLKAVTDTICRYNYEEKNENDVISQVILAPSINPTFTNYLADRFGINACSINWPSINYGGSNSNNGITKFTEFIGNMLYTMAKNSTFTLRYPAAPFTKHFSWRSSSGTDVFAIPATTTYRKVPITSYELALRAPCNLTLNGYVVIQATSACTVKINPVLWQEDSPEQTYDERLALTDFSLEVPLSVGTHVIPLNSVLQGYYSDTNGLTVTGFPAKVMFSLAVCCNTASAAKVTGFSATINAFSSDIGKPVEISRPMGTADDYTSENDIPTQEIVYPTETVRSSDAGYND